MTHGDLFAGIGGFSLGFEKTGGIKTKWLVEIDDYCQKVLAKHFPEAKRFSDIKEVGVHNLEKVDIISGGFPCQDISVAGKRVGLSGERSGLWFEMFRVISELRPRFAVVENVPMLIRLGLDRVLADFAGIGYDAEWTIISARDAGAPHLRKRIWIVAYPQKWQNNIGKSRNLAKKKRGGESINTSFSNGSKDDSDPAGLQRAGESSKICGRGQGGDGFGDLCEDVSDTHSERELQSQGTIKNEWERFGNGDWWAVEPGVGRLANGIPHRMDRLRALGNAIVPQIAEYIGHRIIETEDDD